MPPKRKAAPIKEKEVGEPEVAKKEVKAGKKGATKKAEEAITEATEPVEAADTNGETKAKRGRKEKAAPAVEESAESPESVEAADTNGDTKPKKGRGKDKAAPVEKKSEESAETPEPTEPVDANGETKPKKGRGKDKAAPIEKKNEESDHAETPEPEETVETNDDVKTKRGKKDKAAPVEKKDEDELKEDAETNGDAKPKKGRGKGKVEKAAAAEKEESADEIEEKEESPVPEEPVKEKRGRGRKAAAPKAEEDEAEPPKRSRRQVKAPVYEEAEDEEDEKKDDDDEEPAKPKGRGRAKKAPKEEENGEEDKPKARGRAKKEKEPQPSTSKSGELMNPTETDYEKIDFSCEKENALGKQSNFIISSWNVDGLRAWLKKDGLKYLEYEKPDVFCIQESKCGEDKLPAEVKNLEGYEQYWQESDKEGYAGVALFSRTKPLNVKFGIGVAEHDEEGRCVTAEFENFYVVSVYVPNAGRKLVTLPKRLEWNKAFKTYVKELDEKKPVIVCGDMNVAHSEIDLANPKTNAKNAGFTKEEREGMTEFLADGYVDTYRKFYPDKTGAYTFWTYMMKSRSKNVGWRLDYFIVSERFVDNVCDSVIRSPVLGSDHCPITLFLNV